MISQQKQIRLKRGPSREQMFDCQRLGSTIPQLSFIDFWGEQKLETGGRSGSRLDIKIEGTHIAGDSGRDWFFWGRLVHVTYGESFAEIVKVEEKTFCFGKWNTYHRDGFIQFSEISFFTHPVQDEEEPVVADLVVADLKSYSNCTLRKLPWGRYKTIFDDKLGSGKKAELELQPYGGKLRVRFLCGNSVMCAGRLIEFSQWTLVNPDPDELLEQSLQKMIQFLNYFELRNSLPPPFPTHNKHIFSSLNQIFSYGKNKK